MEYIGMAMASPCLNSIPLIVFVFVHSLVSTVAMLGEEVYHFLLQDYFLLQEAI